MLIYDPVFLHSLRTAGGVVSPSLFLTDFHRDKARFSFEIKKLKSMLSVLIKVSLLNPGHKIKILARLLS